MTHAQMEIFGLNSYHNTITVEDQTVLQSLEKKARSQEEMILKFMNDNPRMAFTPVEIHLLFGQRWPITSVRRALSNLTKQDRLIMTGQKRMGLYGMENNCWKIKE